MISKLNCKCSRSKLWASAIMPRKHTKCLRHYTQSVLLKTHSVFVHHFLVPFCIFRKLCKLLRLRLYCNQSSQHKTWVGCIICSSAQTAHNQWIKDMVFNSRYYTDSKPKLTIVTPTSVTFCSVPAAHLSNFKIQGDISTARDLSSALEKPSVL